MTQDEVAALFDTLMVAVRRLVDARMGHAVKSEICTVRYVEDNNVYIRQSSNVTTPIYINPSSMAQLDDGDIRVPNISGHVLVAGDAVEAVYTSSIDDAVIVRKIVYSPVDPGGGHSDVEPSDALPKMDGTGSYSDGASPGVASTYSRGDHTHPSDSSKLAVGAMMTNQEIENILSR